jgi:hypothetical protein
VTTTVPTADAMPTVEEIDVTASDRVETSTRR